MRALHRGVDVCQSRRIDCCLDCASKDGWRGKRGVRGRQSSRYGRICTLNPELGGSAVVLMRNPTFMLSCSSQLFLSLPASP
eukprot:scaffold193172_cov31-Tisochrysis_lutea.AAC.3